MSYREASGLSGALVGIDVRPADGLLYGVSADGSVVTVDPTTGKAVMKAKLETMLAPGTMATIDFNPVADRLRIIGSDGTNLRANVDDGKVTKDSGAANKGDIVLTIATPSLEAPALAGEFTDTLRIKIGAQI